MKKYPKNPPEINPAISAAASALGKASWESRSKDKTPEDIHATMSALGKRGGRPKKEN